MHACTAQRLFIAASLYGVLFACQAERASAQGSNARSPARSATDSGIVQNANRPAARRTTLTPTLEQNAFSDAEARHLLSQARAARARQDSALREYTAKGTSQYSWYLATRDNDRERLAARNQQAARVRWTRDSGVWAEPLGTRDLHGGIELTDFTDLIPIPYWKGREALWIPTTSDEGTDINTSEIFHPLGADAEADYRYATGDSLRVRLQEGQVVHIRELKVTPRRAEWHLVVGSFWFDGNGNLVRAVYRLAAPIEFWDYAMEPHRDSVAAWNARAATDTGRVAQQGAQRPRMTLLAKIGLGLIAGSFRPFTMNFSAVSVEYGLYGGQFWLPRRQSAQRDIRAGPLRVRMQWNEKYSYESVNGNNVLPAVPALPVVGDDTTLWVARGKAVAADTSAQSVGKLATGYQLAADSLRERVRTLSEAGGSRARELSKQADANAAYARQVYRRQLGCAAGKTYYAGTINPYIGNVRVALLLPCDEGLLAQSAELPASIYDTDTDFTSEEQDALLHTLDFSTTSEWNAAKPRLLFGLSLLRYNRVEGLSVGASATSSLGRGYNASLEGRVGLSDVVPNGELAVTRTNGRRDWGVAAYHRLQVANDDWGAPLSIGASVNNLLFARDEGFYYRAWGAEISNRPSSSVISTGTSWQWKVFANRQRTAGSEPNTQSSLAHAARGSLFTNNIDAATLSAAGASADVSRTFGPNALGMKFDARGRMEGAFTHEDSAGVGGYGRTLFEGTYSANRGVLGVAMTAAAGTSVGVLPIQRAFFVGGLQTVRGQFARSEGDGRVGNSFWLARTEFGVGGSSGRLAAYYDIGRAGSRADFFHAPNPLSGVGIGASIFDGLIRMDLARGLKPPRGWRIDLALGARF
ncbi:MAG: hypothetical protein H7Z40_08865 [Phycisphaerae bacterium]|nr:hypothetical protein [Gemmatimonadaceae bacterium]